MTLVFYLDRYHLADPLFLTRFARNLGGLNAPRVLVHGAAEDGERLLEGEGGVPVWRDGVLVVGSEAERAIVERAARDLNRRIAHALNDAGVPAVRLDGASRGLLEQDQDGVVHVSEGQWLADLVAQGAVPVVAALVRVGAGPLVQLNGGAVAAALARQLPDGAALFLSRSAVPQGVDVSIDDLPPNALAEPEALHAALGATGDVRLCSERAVSSAESGAVRLLESG